MQKQILLLTWVDLIQHINFILGSIAYGIDIKPEDILIEGIQNISKTDMNLQRV